MNAPITAKKITILSLIFDLFYSLSIEMIEKL